MEPQLSKCRCFWVNVPQEIVICCQVLWMGRSLANLLILALEYCLTCSIEKMDKSIKTVFIKDKLPASLSRHVPTL